MVFAHHEHSQTKQNLKKRKRHFKETVLYLLYYVREKLPGQKHTENKAKLYILYPSDVQLSLKYSDEQESLFKIHFLCFNVTHTDITSVKHHTHTHMLLLKSI